VAADQRDKDQSTSTGNNNNDNNNGNNLQKSKLKMINFATVTPVVDTGVVDTGGAP
jgi:hypothetical protein